MSATHVAIPSDLLSLKPSEALQSVSMSSLARKGTTILQSITETLEPVAVQVQGQGSMVTLSRTQYDEMVALIHQLQADDGFTQVLEQRFDNLMAQMNESSTMDATHNALFSDPATLNETYRPGTTETQD